MKVFVTGACGQLGYDVIKELRSRHYTVLGSDIQSNGTEDENYVKLDITNELAVYKTICAFYPDVIIHCAAWTNVDDAEIRSNRHKVQMINDLGTQFICKAAKELNCKLVYISTDYVFDGQGSDPWSETDKPNPINFYGKSKYLGEIEVSHLLTKFFILRIAWVFGLNGRNFVKTMINAGRKHDFVKVVNDQIGCPTYTHDLATLIADVIQTNKYGIYHVTNAGEYISWYDFCKEIYNQCGLDTNVIPVSTAEYGQSVAKRPMNSRLNRNKLVECGFNPLPHWKDALHNYIIEAQLTTLS